MDNFWARFAAWKCHIEVRGKKNRKKKRLSLFYQVRCETTGSQTSTDPVLLVDVLSHFLQFFVTGKCFNRAHFPFHGNGHGEKAVDHNVGIATDG